MDIIQPSQQLIKYSNFKDAISIRYVMSKLIFWWVSNNDIPRKNNDSLGSSAAQYAMFI